MPAAVAIFFAAILAMYSAITVPVKEAQHVAAKADVAAVSVLAYRSALTAYLNANPAHTGNIPDTSITMPAGMARDPNWTNSTVSRTLYVFEAVPTKKTGLIDQLYIKMEKSHLVGRNQGGNFVNAKGYNTGALPVTTPAIPDGSIVIIGK